MSYFDNLLRPIFEFRAALISFCLAFVAISFKEMMLFLPALGLAVGLFLILYGIYSMYKGIKLKKYQKGLVATEYFTMTCNEVYKSASSYFIGLGFEWKPEHTKRFRDLSDRRNQQFLYATKTEERLKLFALKNKDNPILSPLHKFLNSHSLLNPYPIRQGTGTPAIHGIGMWEGESKMYMDISATNHILVVGTTGGGKSSALNVLSAQDVASGRATITIDPKGGYKVFSSLYNAAVSGEKVDQFKIIHLAFPEHSAQYNALGQYHRITEIAGRITQGVDTEGAFKDFAWLKANFIAVGLHYIGESADFEKIKYYMTRCDDLVIQYCLAYIDRNTKDKTHSTELLKETLKENIDGHNPLGHTAKSIKIGKAVSRLIYDGLLPDSAELQTMLSYLNEDVRHERKLVRNIEPILEKLTTGSIAQIMIPDYDNFDSVKDIIDWGQVFNDGEVVYIGTNALGDTTISSTFIQIVLEDISNYLGSLYQYGSDYRHLDDSKEVNSKFLPENVVVHIDELSAIRTEAVANLLARVGEVGVKLRIYTQSAADLVRTFGDREAAEAAIDNFGGLMFFRVGNKNTADILVSRLREVGIEKEGRVYGFTDSPKTDSAEDFSSSAMQREEIEYVPLVSHDILMSLPTGHAFFLTNGSRLDKLRLPLIEVDDDVAPINSRDMIEVMKKNDAYRITPTTYSDTWFKNQYPEFSSGHRDLSFSDDEPLGNKPDSKGGVSDDVGLTSSVAGLSRDALDTDSNIMSGWE